ncbi:2-hydroxyacyl-CoA dehydratase [Chloroflexota bacterium]
MKRIGITTTVPLEILLAAGYLPVDLNNLLVESPCPEKFLAIAEAAGFPVNCCSWIKGIYGVAMTEGLGTILCVTGGDCSNTQMLMEVFRVRGLRVVPFAYPPEPRVADVKQAITGLAATLGTTLTAAGKYRRELAPCRSLAARLDELTWQGNQASGWENHFWLVTASDFNGDVGKYENDLGDLVSQCVKRKPYPDDWLRLAYIGVPPVYARDLHTYLERHQAHVVFNEVQRQFALLQPGVSLASQYAHYTYPYPLKYRLRDILTQLEQRKIDGVIHYVQAFCHRAIANIVFKEKLSHPILTLEGGDDFTLDSHAKTRIEAFLDMLRRRKGRGSS